MSGYHLVKSRKAVRARCRTPISLMIITKLSCLWSLLSKCWNNHGNCTLWSHRQIGCESSITNRCPKNAEKLLSKLLIGAKEATDNCGCGWTLRLVRKHAAKFPLGLFKAGASPCLHLILRSRNEARARHRSRDAGANGETLSERSKAFSFSSISSGLCCSCSQAACLSANISANVQVVLKTFSPLSPSREVEWSERRIGD